MFGVGKSKGGLTIAIVSIESGSAMVAILTAGRGPELLAYAREELPLQERAKDAVRSGVIQALRTAGEKALVQYANASGRSAVASCYCIVSAPWTHSFSEMARSRMKEATLITDQSIGALAKDALADQKDIEASDLFEANVSRVLLNGYPTSEPAGKHAQEIDLSTLLSDCDPEIKKAASETIGKLFPGAAIIWRSSARTMLAAAVQVEPTETCLIVEVSGEATDLLAVRKGALEQRIVVEHGIRQILETLAKGKPAEETLSLMQMLEKDQSDSDAGEDLRQTIAKAEPNLVHVFGEALAKLSTPRKLPDDLILIAPTALAPWLSRFFARIDFTQFTATPRPFSVKPFEVPEFKLASGERAEVVSDPSLRIGYNLVNIELLS